MTVTDNGEYLIIKVDDKTQVLSKQEILSLFLAPKGTKTCANYERDNKEEKQMGYKVINPNNNYGGYTIGIDPYEVDPIVEEVRRDLLNRSQIGLKKYGVSLNRTDIDLKGWLTEAYHECLDMANYLKRTIKELENKQTQCE